MREAGFTQRAIARMVGVTQSEVSRLLAKVRATGSVRDRPRSGQPRKTDAREDRVLTRLAVKNRFKSASVLAREWGHQIIRAVSKSTVLTRLRNANLRF